MEEPDDDLNEFALACLYGGLVLLEFEFFLDWTALDTFSARSPTKLSSDVYFLQKGMSAWDQIALLTE